MHSNRILWPQSYTRVIWIIIQTKYFACRFIWRGKNLSPVEVNVQSKMTIFEDMFDCDFNWKSIFIHWAEEPKSSQISRLTNSAMPTQLFFTTDYSEWFSIDLWYTSRAAARAIEWNSQKRLKLFPCKCVNFGSFFASKSKSQISSTCRIYTHGWHMMYTVW